MSSKLMRVGATSALLVGFACGCAAQTGSDEGTSPDEQTATEQSAVVGGYPYGNDNGYGDGDGNGYRNGNRSDPRATWGRGERDYGRGNAPAYSSPGYNSPGAGRGHAEGYGRRYNNPPDNYGQPGYGSYGPAYNSPSYQPRAY